MLGHVIYVYIHPYMDGNGGTGRFLMNVMMAAAGYPLSIALPVHGGPASGERRPEHRPLRGLPRRPDRATGAACPMRVAEVARQGVVYLSRLCAHETIPNGRSATSGQAHEPAKNQSSDDHPAGDGGLRQRLSTMRPTIITKQFPAPSAGAQTGQLHGVLLARAQ